MAGRLLKRVAMFVAALMMVLGLPLVAAQVVFQAPASAAGAAPVRTVGVTITEINCGSACDGEGIEGIGEGPPDWYAKVFMNGDAGQRQDAPDDIAHIHPNWLFNKQIPMTQQTMPVRIQVWDRDSSSDDLADDTKEPGDKNLDFTINFP
ncbi:MAG: hypothetical protein C5B55_00855, partial [Blastocatellia bacterium]